MEEEKIVLSKETVSLLKEAFEAGCNKRQAAIYAKITLTQLAGYELQNPVFLQEIMNLEAAKEAYARVAVLKKVKRAAKDETPDAKSDAEFAKWLLERISEEFKPKSSQDVTSAGKALPTLIQIVQPHE